MSQISFMYEKLGFTDSSVLQGFLCRLYPKYKGWEGISGEKLDRIRKVPSIIVEISSCS